MTDATCPTILNEVLCSGGLESLSDALELMVIFSLSRFVHVGYLRWTLPHGKTPCLVWFKVNFDWFVLGCLVFFNAFTGVTVQGMYLVVWAVLHISQTAHVVQCNCSFIS